MGGANPEYLAYHDAEWGRPVVGDAARRMLVRHAERADGGAGTMASGADPELSDAGKARAARRGFDFLRPTQVPVKGRPEPVEAFEAEKLRQDTAASAAETPFAGRAAERDQLLALPATLAADFAAEDDPHLIETRLRAEITRVLARLSQEPPPHG